MIRPTGRRLLAAMLRSDRTPVPPGWAAAMSSFADALHPARAPRRAGVVVASTQRYTLAPPLPTDILLRFNPEPGGPPWSQSPVIMDAVAWAAMGCPTHLTVTIEGTR